MALSEETGFSRRPQALRWILFAAFAVGAAHCLHYYAQGLTTAHYDAKAHLLVARRIVDSMEPGYAQMGVHWLPLIHLLYLPIVMFDSQYRSGLLPALISVAAFALSVVLTYKISYRFTGSAGAALLSAVVLAANPNLLYLQSCPLTEPLYMLLMLLALDGLIAWRESNHARLPWAAAAWASLGALGRYEGWYFMAGVLLLLANDWRIRYLPRRTALRAGAVYLVVFAAPAAAHFGYIYHRLGDSFFLRVAQGNPDPYLTYKRPFLSALYHLGELSQVATVLPLVLAAAGVLLFLNERRDWNRRAPLLLLWVPSLINISALYWGLIYLLRYSVLLLPAVGVFAALAMRRGQAARRPLLPACIAAMAMPWVCWLSARINPSSRLDPGPGLLLLPAAALVLFLAAEALGRHVPAAILLCALGMLIPALARENRPMMAETLEHEFMEPERREVLRYLERNYDGRQILIDMGRQAPLVYDSGLPVRSFIYNEGEGARWHEALKAPAEAVGWLIAEDGDALSERLRERPDLTAGFLLAVRTGSFSVYRLSR